MISWYPSWTTRCLNSSWVIQLLVRFPRILPAMECCSFSTFPTNSGFNQRKSIGRDWYPLTLVVLSWELMVDVWHWCSGYTKHAGGKPSETALPRWRSDHPGSRSLPLIFHTLSNPKVKMWTHYDPPHFWDALQPISGLIPTGFFRDITWRSRSVWKASLLICDQLYFHIGSRETPTTACSSQLWIGGFRRYPVHDSW